ncbi:MAG: hypothetical protein GKR92_05305 [Gammaproteobacteria bacterium]|nr:MAG: hypothetical protein GKR92_05305 [Gammaproteobacteria bacterium]
MGIDESKAKLQKAIDILNENNIPKSLEWLMDNRIGISDGIEMDSSKTKEDYENCQIVKRFTYKNNNYELFYVNGHSFHTYGDTGYHGDFRLFFNSELVIETTYLKNYLDNEWDSVSKSILFHDFAVKSIKLKKDWVNDTSTLVGEEKRKIEEIEEEKIKKDEEDSKKIDEGIDLGDFE